VVVVQSLEYLVDLGLRVAAAGLECLRHQVEELPPVTVTVTDVTCMYDHGTNGSNLSLFNNATIPAGEALPSGHYVNEEAPDQVFDWFMRFFAAEPAPRHGGADPSDESDSSEDGPPTGGQSVADLFARLHVEPSGGGRRRRRDG